jgi:hypothetical protein
MEYLVTLLVESPDGTSGTAMVGLLTNSQPTGGTCRREAIEDAANATGTRDEFEF